jgi:hypothetical protein
MDLGGGSHILIEILAGYFSGGTKGNRERTGHKFGAPGLDQTVR